MIPYAFSLLTITFSRLEELAVLLGSHCEMHAATLTPKTTAN